MFTGIVTDIGHLTDIRLNSGGAQLRIECSYEPATIGIGASIACAGVCLTVTDKGQIGHKAWFAAEVSPETLGVTTLGALCPGDSINLERSLKAGDELGGHIVQGHVDGIAQIVERTPDGESLRYRIDAPHHLARFIAPKGAVTLDGTSLTVNNVLGATFGINIIPHTRGTTTWRWRNAGDRVNLEIDVLARYVARLTDATDTAE